MKLSDEQKANAKAVSLNVHMTRSAMGINVPARKTQTRRPVNPKTGRAHGIYPEGTVVWVREPGIALQWADSHCFSCKYLSDGTTTDNPDADNFKMHNFGKDIGNGKGFANGIPKAFARTYGIVRQSWKEPLCLISDEDCIKEGVLKEENGSFDGRYFYLPGVWGKFSYPYDAFTDGFKCIYSKWCENHNILPAAMEVGGMEIQWEDSE